MIYRPLAASAGFLLMVFVAGCGSDSTPHTPSTPSAPRAAGTAPQPVDTAVLQFCAQNLDPTCTTGTYVGPWVSLTASGGHWDANGAPVNGGPVGADRSTGNRARQ